MNGSLSAAGQVNIMRDNNQRAVLAGIERKKKIDHGIPGGGIKITGRLVAQ